MINHVMINEKRTSPPKTICLGDEVLVVPPQVHRNVAIPVSSSPFPFILRTVLNPVLYIGSTRSTIPDAARFVPADRSEACFNAVFSPILSIRALCIKKSASTLLVITFNISYYCNQSQNESQTLFVYDWLSNS